MALEDMEPAQKAALEIMVPLLHLACLPLLIAVVLGNVVGSLQLQRNHAAPTKTDQATWHLILEAFSYNH
jgi:hypothetical protein